MADLITIGIDPGLTGGIAFLGPACELQWLADLPVKRDGASLAWIDGAVLRKMIVESLQDRPGQVVLERAQAIPKQSSTAGFNYGVGFGAILAVVDTLYMPLHLVAPGRWKRAIGLGREPEEKESAYKRRSLEKARLWYPAAQAQGFLTLSKHEGRAEALLLAHYFLNRNSLGGKP